MSVSAEKEFELLQIAHDLASWPEEELLYLSETLARLVAERFDTEGEG